MIALDLIGIGTGNPEHVTLAAIRAMREADLILVPRKGDDKGDLADLRRQICAAHLPDLSRVVEFDLPVRDASAGYLDGVNDWHDAIAARWAGAIAAHLPGGGRVALLVWGDPSLYDSTLRIAARLGLRPRVVPGVTSLSVLTAAHAIPLNDLGAPVVITTGRRLREGGWPKGADAVAVMLDAGGAFSAVPAEGVTIWWGAYLGMPHEALIAGPLADVARTVLETRAALRARHGWIMDIYLLRR
ncbi:MAG: precorrin-6A synthase (deacetylating) [Rhodobacter sp.]|uniref:precorrin-6A synthase (deacetylating) n=1 Tax=Pararhodobacter sp. TaxID=2127056 RepID=UPI001D7CD42D|nr:precorrin-6A synthase (deacetylating) [Pararhodobacter sp.]MCB1346511.1 precorrin-6A synthase (deacetylating) [Paracoccaceae bacterium]MCC0072761.1 precorrin-6A synthase (deacetylating) [Rhodobacter sp.]HPD93229.1 precorrin-6A synthase (deacetylating) [Pararhodobacter sp.]